MKKISYIIGGIVLLIIIIGIIKFNFINDDIHTTDENTPYTNHQKGGAKFINEKTGAIKTTETNKEKIDNEEIKIAIISPEENEFYSGEAKLWEAKIEGFSRKDNKDYQCYWTWYINGEKKWENLKGCKSTRAVPFNPGNMTVKLRVDFTQTNYSNGKKEVKILESKTVTKKYTLLSR